MQLRPYQLEALAAIVQNLKDGIRQQLLVLATGTGKTVIFAQLPSLLKDTLPGKMLVVAHRDELLQQAVEKIKYYNPTLKVGMEKAEQHADPNCDIIVASNASIGRKGSNRMEHFWDDISVIVVDESHHILGGSYMNILEDSGVLSPESKKLLLGFTATPRRRNVVRKEKLSTLDDEALVSLKSVFRKIVYNYPIRTAIKDGFLVPLHGYRIATKTDLNSVKVTAGDFAADSLSNAVNTPERNAQIVEAWKENADGRSTVCFTVDIQHGKDLAEEFCRNGVLAQAIWGDDPKRADKLKEFENGGITVLCNCALLTEGFDSPKVSCITLARPTKSSTLYTQMVGRGTRLHLGKDKCIVLDVVDNYKRNTLNSLPTLVGLRPDFNLNGGSVTAAISEVEALQEKYPGVSFEHLTDLSKVKTFVESIDLFAEPYTEEVKEYSKLSWMTMQDGSYMLSIPELKSLTDAKRYAAYQHEKWFIKPNELSEYEVVIKDRQNERKVGEYTTLENAFREADAAVRRFRADRVKPLDRSATWLSYDATPTAKKYLSKLSKKQPINWCLCEMSGPLGTTCPACQKQKGITAGQVSTAINKLKSK